MTDIRPYIHDDVLGYAPNPGFCGPGVWDKMHTIDAEGLRSTGERPASREGPILAVGDSYTYGDEVSDEETWPAQLQKLTGRPVLNGGVTGYGFDQIVLRTEQLVARHNPSLVIMGFITDDLRRTEARRMWWRNKPWFAIENDQLVLKGVPVPNRLSLPPRIRTWIEAGLSRLPEVLQHLVGYHVRVHPSGFGLAIAQRLTERLGRLQAERGIRIVLMAQYPPTVWEHRAEANEQRRCMQALFHAAAACGIATLDIYPRLATEPKPLAYYQSWHMNARGNLMVARLLAATLPGLLAGEEARNDVTASR